MTSLGENPPLCCILQKNQHILKRCNLIFSSRRGIRIGYLTEKLLDFGEKWLDKQQQKLQITMDQGSQQMIPWNKPSLWIIDIEINNTLRGCVPKEYSWVLPLF